MRPIARTITALCCASAMVLLGACGDDDGDDVDEVIDTIQEEVDEGIDDLQDDSAP